ncbi:uncharacterized protein LOC125202585 [Salvia hispanica]|uniref:uncharacterized protein LOC125202585 n=1 Tax=Salvia hispanica TaxID=49212 RepID=UPI0020093CD3|nr:uncharacterized protein LOC125202585 [Salvia hispanica]
MEEEMSKEVQVDQPIFSRIHFSGLTVGLSYQFVILVYLSGWAALEILRLSSETANIGKTTLAISYLIVEMRGSSLGRSTTHSDGSPPLGPLKLLDENSEEEYSTAPNVEGEGRDAATNNAKKWPT